MKVKTLFLLGLCILILTTTSLAQTWSKEQKEVLKTAEQLWLYFAAGDIENVSKMVHPEFVFWNVRNSVPGDKTTANRLDMTWVKLGGEWEGASISPLTIKVFDEFAIVNTYLRGFQKQPGENPVFVTIRWHSTWKKENGKWLQLSNFLYLED